MKNFIDTLQGRLKTSAMETDLVVVTGLNEICEQVFAALTLNDEAAGLYLS